MSKARYPSHIVAVLAFLEKVGSVVEQVRLQRRIVIEWRRAGHRHHTALPSVTRHPDDCATRAIFEVQSRLSRTGVAA